MFKVARNRMKNSGKFMSRKRENWRWRETEGFISSRKIEIFKRKKQTQKKTLNNEVLHSRYSLRSKLRPWSISRTRWYRIWLHRWQLSLALRKWGRWRMGRSSSNPHFRQVRWCRELYRMPRSVEHWRIWMQGYNCLHVHKCVQFKQAEQVR